MRGSLATTTFSFAAAGEVVLVQSIYIQRLPNDILGGFTLFGLSEGAAGIESPRGSYKVSGFPPRLIVSFFFHTICIAHVWSSLSPVNGRPAMPWDCASRSHGIQRSVGVFFAFTWFRPLLPVARIS